MANCTKCGASLRDGAKFCGSCGAKIEARRFCTECGEELEPGDKFCIQCGTPAEDVSVLKTPVAPVKLRETELSHFLIEDCAGGCRIRKYTGPVEGAVVIPSSIGGKKVLEIGDRAFYNRDSLTSITIPDSVTVIGSEAFLACTSLTSITIPGSVTEIGRGAFYNCMNLTSITISNGVTKIGYDAFCYCDSLTSINIPDSVSEIGEEAFYNCYRLTIRASAGSTAERYAKENGIHFRPL